MNRLQRVVAVLGLIVVLVAAAYSLLPFSLQVGRFPAPGGSDCSPAVVSAWKTYRSGDSILPTACASAARRRVLASGVVIGLAVVGSAVALLILRNPKMSS